MIEYTIYNKSTGQILSTGIAQQKSDIEDRLNENTDVLWIQTSGNQYVIDGDVLSIPDKPDGEYVFDYSIKQWVFDAESTKTNALIKRDRLLAEGPDRISPMWWASMTEQEQQAWTFYRQSLLDITEQADYPEFIVWPIKP